MTRIDRLERGHVTKALLDVDAGRLVLVLAGWSPEDGDPVLPAEDEIREAVSDALGRPVQVASQGGEGYGNGDYADVWRVEEIRRDVEPDRHYAAVWPYGRGVVDEAGRAACGMWVFDSRRERDRYVEDGPAYMAEPGYREAIEPAALPVGWSAADLAHVRRY
jgi:hypothetical protein